MVAGKKIAVLRFEGPLQSWGEKADGDVRPTADFPTKSGIAGLIGCAMGIESRNKMIKDICDSMTVVVRADRAGVKMWDFQTVAGEPLRTHAGTRRANGDRAVTKRQYIQDGSFTVFIEFSSEDLHNKATTALKNPEWLLYLGRECCVPSRPVFDCVTEEYDGLIDAVKNYKLCDRHDTVIGYETEIALEGLPTYTRQDVTLSSDREFGVRRVWRGVL